MKREILIRKLVKAFKEKDAPRLAALARLYMGSLGKKELAGIDKEIKRRAKNG